MIATFGAGAAGIGEEAGADPLTQHGLSQAQRRQHDAEFPSALAVSAGPTASNKLNKMANIAFNKINFAF